MMRLHPGAGIISWKADCSPKVMRLITTSPEPWRTKIEIITNQAAPISGTV
jgi:hypothetical protein